MNTDMKVDALIAGGGPAGLSAAISASNRGCDVVLIEKCKEIGRIIRTSGLSWIEEINDFDIPSSFYNPLKKYYMYSPNNKISLETENPKACVLDVTKLYQHLAQKASTAGARIQLDATIKKVEYHRSKKEFTVYSETRKKQNKYFSKVVIDASGYSRVAASSLGLAAPCKRIGVGAEYLAEVENIEKDAAYFMVGNQYSPAGYAWIFPTGENIARIGVGIGRPESSKNPLQHLEFLLKRRPPPFNELGKISPLELHEGIIPNCGVREKSVFERLLLVGDAAGQSNPMILEGIRFAIRFGHVAGDTVGKSIMNNDVTMKSLEEYEERWKKILWNNFHIAYNVQKKWLSMSDSEWDNEFRLLKCLPADDFIRLLKTDFSIKHLMNLLFKHPSLASTETFRTILGSIRYLI